MAAATGDYSYTATGPLGIQRETMLHNALLLRDQLGKPMRRGYTSYPGEEARYGRPNVSIDGGAPEALQGWHSGIHFPRSGKDGAGTAERDFMALNRLAVQAGLTTAPEQYQFRATHDFRRKVKSEDSGKKHCRRLPPSMVFGISTRPSTPIHDLLENRYQDKWMQEQKRASLSASQNDFSGKLAPGKVYDTRASMLRISQVPVQSAPLWQMPKFSKNAFPHLETFRSDQARSAAFKHHQSDCISRKGVFGHGIYEQAKN